MMYDQYIKKLAALKEANENRIIAIIPDMETFAYQALIDWMDESLDIKNGNLIASAETVSILNGFDSAFLRVLNQIKAYEGAVSKFLKHLPEMSDVIEEYQVGTQGIKWPDITASEKLVVNDIIEAYTDNGLNTNFVQPVRDQLYQNIAAGTNVREAKASLKDYVKGAEGKDSKIKSYLIQTSQQAVDGYTGMINKKLMDTFDYPYLIMSGSLIETSSPQCRVAIKEFDGLINMEAWAVIRTIALKNGLIDGTTFKNLPFNKLHWGCRHEFTPSMIKSGDKIGTNETVKS